MNTKDYEELSEFAECEGSELGDYATSLLVMRDYNTDHGMSKEFDIALELELSKLLANFKEYGRIIEITETYTRTFKEFEWSGL